MFDLSNIKVLHIEPTDVCQAACPLCARETDISFNKSIKHHLTIDDILKVVSLSEISNLDKMFMCGVYGEPAAGSHTLDIYDFFRENNEDIVLGMNTNGGLRDEEWWIRLANTLNHQKDYVVFSIDGLADTNHIYRKNVNWDILMRNAMTFIEHGGSAHWDMLVYDHNAHQVEQCEMLAKAMGFSWFRTKVSNRDSSIQWLKSPKGWDNPTVSSNVIDCQAIKENSVYIDAQGRIFPCCWQASSENTLSKVNDLISSWNSEFPNKRCKINCGSKHKKNSFVNQWQMEVKLV